MASKKVIVVGAGAAGIYTTYLLRRAGIDVLCLEASDDVCGRVRAFEKNGYICETGALGLENQFVTVCSLIDELGLRDKVNIGSTVRVGFYRKGKLNIIGLGTPAQQLKWLPRTLAFRGISLKAIKQSSKVVKAMQQDIADAKTDGKSLNENYYEKLLPLGKVSLSEYVLKYGGQEALDNVFGAFMSLMVLGNAEDVSVTHAIALINDNMETFGGGGGFMWMERGIDEIFRTAYEKDKECYRLSCPVDEIVIEDGAVKGIRAGGEFIEAENVFCCTSSVDALKIIPNLPDAIVDILKTVKYSSTYNYMFGNRSQFTPTDFTMEFVPRTKENPKPLFKVFFDATYRSKSYAPKGGTLLHAMTSYDWADTLDAMSEAERTTFVINETRKVFPKMPEKPELIECVHFSEAISLDRPGQINALYEYETKHTEDVEGLYLAGEYMYPLASSEGACKSAKRAVERLQKNLAAER